MGASADAIPVIEFDDALPAIEGGDARQATTTAKFAKRDRPAIRPGRLASASILGKLRLEKVLLKRFKTMRRKTVKLTAAALELPHEHLAKYSEDQERDERGRWTSGGQEYGAEDQAGARILYHASVGAYARAILKDGIKKKSSLDKIYTSTDPKESLAYGLRATREWASAKGITGAPKTADESAAIRDKLPVVLVSVTREGFSREEYEHLFWTSKTDIPASQIVRIEVFKYADVKEYVDDFSGKVSLSPIGTYTKAEGDSNLIYLFVPLSIYFSADSEKLAKAGAGADKTARQILDALAMEWEYVAREAASPLMDAALAGASIGGLQLDISSADMLDSINTVARDWAADRAAEMVGMRRTEEGGLIPNPDARWAISDTTRENLRDVVTGLFDAEGELSLRDVETAIEDAGIFSDTRATMIANTEISRAQTEGNREAWRQSGVVEKVDVVLSALHDLEDECDEAADGSPYDLEDAPDIPLHPNCCLPGTLVSACGRIAAQMSRWYEGEVITLSVEGIDDLTVTPNHPVLTGRGWIPAGELQQGVDFIGCRLPGPTPSVISPNDEDVPTRIEEIAHALLKSGGMATSAMPVSAEDFHGDGVTDSEVDVVWAAGFLRGDWNIAESASEIAFQPRAISLAPLHPERSATEFIETGVRSAPSGVSGSGVSLALARAKETLMFDIRAESESVASEERADTASSDAEALGDSIPGFSGEIALVKLSGVERRNFAGHVYNLTTEFGWYSANGIITHNCECSLVLSEIGEGESAEEE